MDELDHYEVKVLMHRIRYERGDNSESRPCTECGARTSRHSGPCTACLVKRLAGYIGWHLAVEFDRVVVRMATVEDEISRVLGKSQTRYSPCPLTFKSDQCGYCGPESNCGKSFEDCKRLGNELRFAGWGIK